VRVRVLDHIDDVRPYLALSDLLVLPTKREGLPNVVLEAAAMGKPAVTTTATGAIDSVIDGETGLLVAATDEAIAEGLARLVGDPEMSGRMGDRARTEIAPRYTWERGAEDFLAACRSLDLSARC